MRKLMSLFGLVFLVASGPALAAEKSPEDAYAACLIGNAIVEIHGGLDKAAAAESAFVECRRLGDAVHDEAEAEGISDFLYLTLDQVSPDPTPTDLGLGQ